MEVSGFGGDSSVSFLRRASVRLVMNEKEEPLRFNCDFLNKILVSTKTQKGMLARILRYFSAPFYY